MQTYQWRLRSMADEKFLREEFDACENDHPSQKIEQHKATAHLRAAAFVAPRNAVIEERSKPGPFYGLHGNSARYRGTHAVIVHIK
jgi:hypothetical protein